MSYVNLGSGVYSNGFETVGGTEGGDDVLVTLSGNTGALAASIGSTPGMAVGKGDTSPFDDDDPIAVFGRPVAGVEMTITNTNGILAASTGEHLLDPTRTLPGEEFAIYINGEKLTQAEMQAALDAGTAGSVGYAINDAGNLIKTDDDPSAIGTLVFEGFPEGIDDFQVDTVHQIDLPSGNTVPNSAIALSVDTAPFEPCPEGAICGTDEDDVLEGTSEDDLILGRAGDDRLVGVGGNDALLGEDGDDTLIGNGGDDLLLGGDGRDKLFGRQDDDFLAGGGDNDRLNGQDGDDILLGGTGRDNLSGGDDNDIVAGGDGDDVLRGNFGDDI